MQVNIYEAKTRFSELIDAASHGKTVVIAKSGTPMAKLSPLDSGFTKGIRLGLMRDEIIIGDDFDAPLPENVLAGFDETDAE